MIHSKLQKFRIFSTLVKLAYSAFFTTDSSTSRDKIALGKIGMIIYNMYLNPMNK